MDMGTLKEKMYGLNQQIEFILWECGYYKTDDLLVDLKTEDPDENMLYDEFMLLWKHLDYVNCILNYLQKPIFHEGIICLNQDGRYMLDGVELCHNDMVEVYVFDQKRKKYTWERLHFKDGEKLNGMKARIRE